VIVFGIKRFAMKRMFFFLLFFDLWTLPGMAQVYLHVAAKDQHSQSLELEGIDSISFSDVRRYGNLAGQVDSLEDLVLDGRILEQELVDSLQKVHANMFGLSLSLDSLQVANLKVQDGMQELKDSLRKVGVDLGLLAFRLDSLETLVRELEDSLRTSSGKIIVGWGDSLTQGMGGKKKDAVFDRVMSILESKGFDLSNVRKMDVVSYPAVLQELTNGNHEVVNCGVNNEKLWTIMARQGAANAKLPFEVILPAAAGDTVLVADGPANVFLKSTYANGPVTPLLQGEDISVNPVLVNGVECRLSRAYESNAPSYDFRSNKWYLTRMQDADFPIHIPVGTPLLMKGARAYRKAYAMIVWAGENGGYSNAEDLCAELDSMMRFSETNKVLIVGLHSGTQSSRVVLETTMADHFGLRYFNLRKYLAEEALAEFGLEPSDEDQAAMAVGSCPKSLLADSIHFTAAGYVIVAYKVFRLLDQMGILEK
jgi:hypothetical protein